MTLVNVVKHEQVGDSKTISTPLANGITKVMANALIAKTKLTVVDTVFTITEHK